MAVRPCASVDPNREALPMVARIGLRRARETVRPHLAVLGPGVSAVVDAVGGWIFDRGSAGWAVTVIVAEASDSRPLRILGARCVDLETVLAETEQGPEPHTLAVCVDLYRNDHRVREGVLGLLECRRVEVTMWGGAWPAELDGHVNHARHHLSRAALAFKTQALRAADAASDSPAAVETFRTAGWPEYRPGGTDLMPSG